MLRLRMLALVCLGFGGISEVGMANCNDKCITRNPFGGECWLKVRACDLSMESVEGLGIAIDQAIEGTTEWLGAASATKVREAFAHVDPVKALAFYSNRLGIKAPINESIAACVVDSAAVGVLGSVCAAGVAELGLFCFAEITCTSTCVGAGNSISNLIEKCAGIQN